MTPEKFDGANVSFAQDQGEYLTLPAYIDNTNQGEVITCWKLSWWELLCLLFTRRLWFRQLTFRHGLQPILPQVEYPFEKRVSEEDRLDWQETRDRLNKSK
jgi:hypothetical protein